MMMMITMNYNGDDNQDMKLKLLYDSRLQSIPTDAVHPWLLLL